MMGDFTSTRKKRANITHTWNGNYVMTKTKASAVIILALLILDS